MFLRKHAVCMKSAAWHSAGSVLLPTQPLPCLTQSWVLAEQRPESTLTNLKDVTETFDASNRLGYFLPPASPPSCSPTTAADFGENLGDFSSAQQINVKIFCLQFVVWIRHMGTVEQTGHCSIVVPN